MQVGHTVEAQISFDRASADFGATLRQWFTSVHDLLGLDVLEELVATPQPDEVMRLWRASKPVGKKGAAWGLIMTIRQYPKGRRTAYRLYSTTEWQRFLAGLSDDLVEAELWFGRISDSGHPGGGGFRAQAEVCERNPDWAYLRLFMGDRWLRDEERERRLLAAMRATADVCDPSFGHVDYYEGGYGTPLEGALRIDANFRLPTSRNQLRGYSWLTVCAQQIGDDLGGAEALMASGAFVEVAQLAGGGYWLLATPTREGYDRAAVEAVFGVLAPKLPPGQPVGVVLSHPELSAPVLLVNRDAATVRSAAMRRSTSEPRRRRPPRPDRTP